jgi:hypothetical protein
MNFSPWPWLEQRLSRYVPLAVWVVTVAVLLLVPLKIISYGFLPPDDALRHAAKAVSGKSWQDILVMRSDFAIDPSPGWQAILSGVFHSSGCGAEALVIFSVVSLMVLVNVTGLPWMRRPEAWLGAILITAVFDSSVITRLALGRPFILTHAMLTIVLFLWGREQDERPRNLTVGITILAIAASAWIHGSWYLWVLPGAAIFFAGFWVSAIWYVICWLVGSFLGSALTGHPWEFLLQSVRHMFGVFGGLAVNRQLEPEMYPSGGVSSVVVAVGILILWRVYTSRYNPRTFLNPIFILMVLGWGLGLHLRRFWWDWGMPAFTVWTALELQNHFEKFLDRQNLRRLFITLALAAGVYLAFTSDLDGRWTADLADDYLTPDKPDLQAWMPGPGGIIYNADMSTFFETFYKNPKAPWKYVLGFEPGLMTPENLKVLRAIQWNYSDLRSFQPWVKAMRQEDRLIIRTMRAGEPPAIPELEWYYGATGIWIGRLPHSLDAGPRTLPK